MSKHRQKNPNWSRSTNRERKAARRADEVGHVSPFTAKDAMLKIEQQAKALPLRRLCKLEKRLGRAAIQSVRDFSTWRAEAPEALANDQWPDREQARRVFTCYQVVATEIRGRTKTFVPLTIVPPWSVTEGLVKVQQEQLQSMPATFGAKVSSMLKRLFK